MAIARMQAFSNNFGILSEASNAGITAGFPSPRQRLPVPRAGVLRNLANFMIANSFDGSTVVTLLVNGVDTGLFLSYAAGETGKKFIAGPDVPVSEGDEISWKIDTTASTSGGAKHTGSIEYVPGPAP